jgi:hypothetical protein
MCQFAYLDALKYFALALALRGKVALALRKKMMRSRSRSEQEKCAHFALEIFFYIFLPEVNYFNFL